MVKITFDFFIRSTIPSTYATHTPPPTSPGIA